MAIARVHYEVIKELRNLNLLKVQGSILELGEQNWYGDIPIKLLHDDIAIYADNYLKEQLVKELVLIWEKKPATLPYDITKIWYKTFFQAKSINAIDLHGTNKALKIDLNLPHELNRQYDYVIDIGTGEHVFNIFQFFQSIHKWTKPNGFIIHCLPVAGDIDHGFYNFHPTFYWDIAHANKYKQLITLNLSMKPTSITQLLSREDALKYYSKENIPETCAIFSLMQKCEENLDFKSPMQGVYDNSIDNFEIKKAWNNQRKNSL